MKKFLLFVLLGLVLFLPQSTLAIDLGTGLAREAAKEAGFDPNTTETSFAETLGDIVRAALSFVGVIFMILMVYAGFMWMTARGEEDKISKAQNIIRAAIIGLIITVGAYSITSFVVPRLIDRASGGSTGSSSPAGGSGSCRWVNTQGSGSQTPSTPIANSAECQAWCVGNPVSAAGWNCEFNGQILQSTSGVCEWVRNTGGGTQRPNTNIQDASGCRTWCQSNSPGVGWTCNFNNQALIRL